MTNLNDEENIVKTKKQETLYGQEDKIKTQNRIQNQNETIPKQNINNQNTKIENNNTGLFKQPWIDKGFQNPNKIDTNFKVPNINTQIKTHDIKPSNNPDDFGKDKNGKEFQLTPIQKDQRNYFDIIQKKRNLEGFPKNPPRTGNIGIFEQPNWRGGTVKMTESEYNNIPSSMNTKEKEKLKFMLDQKGAGIFDIHWNKIKNQVDTIPKEIKGLDREKFNKLNDDDKLRLYNDFIQYERRQKEDGDNQLVSTGDPRNVGIDFNKEHKKDDLAMVNNLYNKIESSESVELNSKKGETNNGNKDQVKDPIMDYSLKSLEEDFSNGKITEKEAKQKIKEVHNRIANILGEKSELNKSDIAKINEYLVEGYTADDIIKSFVQQDNRFKNGPVYSGESAGHKKISNTYANANWNFQIVDRYSENSNKGVINNEDLQKVFEDESLFKEVEIYENGDKNKPDEKITLLQLDEKGDGINDIYRGQCAYFVAKIMNKLYGDTIDYFNQPRGATTLLEKDYTALKDENGKQFLKLDDTPTSGAIYINKNEPDTNNHGHVAIIKDVKVISKTQKDDGTFEYEYEITFLEQNSIIEINDKKYSIPRNEQKGGKYSLAIGERKKNITSTDLKKDGVKFLVKNN